MYAGDFATAVESAEQVLRTDTGKTSPTCPSRWPQRARGDVAGARAVYDRARTAGAIGVSLANMGDADLAIYEGRLADAASILASAIPLDEKNRNSFGAASKSLALAEMLIALDRPAAAVSAAERAPCPRDERILCRCRPPGYSPRQTTTIAPKSSPSLSNAENSRSRALTRT